MEPIDTSKSLDVLLAEARVEGFMRAMQIVDHALGYLTRQPQPGWAREVMEWICSDIYHAQKLVQSDGRYSPAKPKLYTPEFEAVKEYWYQLTARR